MKLSNRVFHEQGAPAFVSTVIGLLQLNNKYLLKFGVFMKVMDIYEEYKQEF